MAANPKARKRNRGNSDGLEKSTRMAASSLASSAAARRAVRLSGLAGGTGGTGGTGASRSRCRGPACWGRWACWGRLGCCERWGRPGPGAGWRTSSLVTVTFGSLLCRPRLVVHPTVGESTWAVPDSQSFRAGSEAELLEAVALHARADHGMASVPDSLVAQVRAKIRTAA